MAIYLDTAGTNSVAGTVGPPAVADILIGLAGDDTYFVDHIGDVCLEEIAGGTDTVASAVNYVLPDFIEILTLSGTTPNHINGTGNALNNELSGNSDNNILDGGLGKDAMIGGGGNDTYIVDNVGDIVTGGAGTDTVISSITFTLDTGNVLENLTLLGKANLNGTGNNLANILTGNAGKNILTGGIGADMLLGNGGDDSLNGGDDEDHLVGGAGKDILDGTDDTITDYLVGGSGNDIYRVDIAYGVAARADVISEQDGGGIDLIESSVTYTLAPSGLSAPFSDTDLQYIENLTLTSTFANNGTGNGLANIIKGNSAANILTGGAGKDTLMGGKGDDVYVLKTTKDDATDRIVENVNEGTDTVTTGITHTLGTNFENLKLYVVDTTETTPINGYGNTAANTIIGNDGTNKIDGKAGNDTLTGGAGNDTLIGGYGNDSMTGGDGDADIADSDGNDVFIYTALSQTGKTSTTCDVITDFKVGDSIDVTAIAGDWTLAKSRTLSTKLQIVSVWSDVTLNTTLSFYYGMDNDVDAMIVLTGVSDTLQLTGQVIDIGAK